MLILKHQTFKNWLHYTHKFKPRTKTKQNKEKQKYVLLQQHNKNIWCGSIKTDTAGLEVQLPEPRNQSFKRSRSHSAASYSQTPVLGLVPCSRAVTQGFQITKRMGETGVAGGNPCVHREKMKASDILYVTVQVEVKLSSMMSIIIHIRLSPPSRSADNGWLSWTNQVLPRSTYCCCQTLNLLSSLLSFQCEPWFCRNIHCWHLFWQLGFINLLK